MTEFTEQEIERLRSLRWTGNATDEALKSIKVGFADVRLLVRRIDELDLDEYHCADEIVRFTLRRLEEDLALSKEYLKDQFEMTRIAELQVKEATRAVAAVKALIDGEMYASGAEVNLRWDEIETEFRTQGFLPEEPELEEPTPEPPPEAVTQDPPPEETESPARASWGQKTRGRQPELVDHKVQEEAVYAALKVAAGDAAQVQVSLKIIGEASGVPHGSVHPVLLRLKDAGRIDIIKVPVAAGPVLPNIYRFTDAPAAKAEEPPLDPAPETPPETPPAAVEPVVAEAVAEKLAEAWGAKVKAPKVSGMVPESMALRDRILGVLGKAACTTSGLASMLDVKELSVCQTLDAMRNEGSVTPEEMPDGGRRAQLWRLPSLPEPATA